MTVRTTLAEPAKAVRHDLSTQAGSLAVILREEFGVPFAFRTLPRGEPVPTSHEMRPEHVSHVTPEQCARFVTETNAQVTARADGRYQVLVPLGDAGSASLLGVASLPGFARKPAEAVEECRRLRKWAQTVRDRLSLTILFAGHHRKEPGPHGSGSLAWETVAGLSNLLGRLRIHKEPAKQQDRILRTAREVLQVGAVIWVPRRPDDEVLVSGDLGLSPWDCRQLAQRAAKSPELEKAGFLICNNPGEKSWGPWFSNIASFVAVAVDQQGTDGLLIAVNKDPGPPRPGAGGNGHANGLETDTLPTAITQTIGDAGPRRGVVAALAAFASLFALHAGASSRYRDMKELVVGLIRALTEAIDARGSWSCGHSERVGRTAIELARGLGLQDDEVRDVYLAGLLHDIGKIGIRDAVLCKEEPLNAEEAEHLEQHVTIGSAILADLRPLRHLIPGVRHHHERYDGGGYPGGLKGDEIPLIARILAVADSYDVLSAHSSPQRATPPEQVEELLRLGTGTQWDPRVVEALFRCHSKVLEAGTKPSQALSWRG